MYDLNPEVNKTPPDPRNLKRGEVCQTGRKSTTNERTQKSLEDQKKVNQATCDRNGLPSDERDWMPELPGFGGDLWWENGGHNGLEEPNANRKVRHVLTKIMKRIVSGQIKCLVVWNVDRLWRDVAICREMLRVLYKYDCLLYDFNSSVNLWTYEGRNAILQNAISSQAVSEAARINSPRGVHENLENGILAGSPNVQGFRSAGRGTKAVKHLLGEQDLVNRIYRLSDQGLSDEAIAKLLMSEGVRLYEESGGKHPNGNSRAPGNEMIVRGDNIHSILRDCKYVGRQRHQTKQQKERGEKGTEYPCEAFLRTVERDGQTVKEPVVPCDLWERIQIRKDASARIGHRGLNFRSLSSLVRCGNDGEALTAQENKMKDGSMVGYWIMRKTRPGCRCKCAVPSVREQTLMDYLLDQFGPLMASEIKARTQTGVLDPHAQKRAGLQQELEAALRYRNGRLSKMLEDESVDAELLRDKSLEIKARIERLQREVAALSADVALPVASEALQALADPRNAPEADVRLAVRQCICWIAVLPVDSPREPKPSYKEGHDDIRYSYAPNIVAKFVFLTTWGTYHTAILYRERTGTLSGYPPFEMRPARPDEAIGGIADFPRSKCFFDGLTRAWAGKAYDWSVEKFAAGWSADESTPMPVAHFEWDDSPEA